MIQKFTGTGVALVTPFHQDLTIDFKALKQLLNFTANDGVDYYVVQGTTGESATTTPAEKAAILAFVKDNNPKRLPIVYGMGGNCTDAVLKTMDQTNFQDIAAVLSVSPYYNKPSQEGIYQHYTTLANHCPVPLLLYNVPGRTGTNISAATTLRLAQHANIIGIKEASGDLFQCMHIVKNKPTDFLLISGDDLLTISMMAIGAVGVISVLANGFPKRFHAMVQAARNHDYTIAQQHVFPLLEMNALMYKEGSPVGIKQVLKALSICQQYVRPPMTMASDQLAQAIQTKVNGCL